MFSQTFQTRFSDTDALGHINNRMLPIWFEGARDPVFELFMPDLDISKWCLILAKIEVNFHAQMYYGQDVEIRTYIGRIGNSSFDVYQELWQGGKKAASGTAVMVHFDHQSQKSTPIPTEKVEQLKMHLYSVD